MESNVPVGFSSDECIDEDFFDEFSDSDLPLSTAGFDSEDFMRDDCESNSTQSNYVSKHTNKKRKIFGKRKKAIDHILEESELEEDTRIAREAEKNRIHNIANLTCNAQSSSTLDSERICLNPLSDGSTPNGPIGSDKFPIMLHDSLSKVLKPHQIDGIRFLWSQVALDPTGYGCLLADFMGLGKTLQVISVIHCFLNVKQVSDHNNANQKWKRVLILAPSICVRNWEAEFLRWLPHEEVQKLRLRILESSKDKTINSRSSVVSSWFSNGGILIIGYDLYRRLALFAIEDNADHSAAEKNLHKNLQACLFSPGPDLIVLDEAHRIRNDNTKLMRSLSSVSTRRRILLTGYPLQNHLKEYWTMINFARPNFLGTREEFKNRFEIPIENGQCIDSSEADIKLARRRAYVLTEEVRPFVLRRDQKYLYDQLPPRREWVLMCKLTPIQAQLYRAFLRDLLGTDGEFLRNRILPSFHISLSVSNHPDVVYNAMNIESEKVPPSRNLGNPAFPNATGNAESKIDVDSSLGDSDFEIVDSGFRSKGHNFGFAEVLMREYEMGKIEHSSKMMLLLEIIKQSELLGDRVTVFSQSIPTLNIIEQVLLQLNKKFENGNAVREYRFLRIDGSTPQSSRFEKIQKFNDPNNNVVVMLISTKAGGEGVNLCGGNRVVMFDVCWNPSHDHQSMCRSYRFGQKKPVVIYRLISAGTMEKKVYDLQVRKEGLSKRIVDDTAVGRRFKDSELRRYFDIRSFKVSQKTVVKHPNEEYTSVSLEKRKEYDDALSDPALKAILDTRIDLLSDFYRQEVLLEEDISEKCPDEDKEQAMTEYKTVKAHGNTVECSKCHHVNNKPSFPLSDQAGTLNCSACGNLIRISVQLPSTISPSNLELSTMSSQDALRISQDRIAALKRNTMAGIPTTHYGNIPAMNQLVSLHTNLLPNKQNSTQYPINVNCTSKANHNYSIEVIDLTQDEAIAPKSGSLKGYKLLMIARGVSDRGFLRQKALELGAEMETQYSTSITHIISDWPIDRVLSWLGLQQIPQEIKHRNFDWLRDLVKQKILEKGVIVNTEKNYPEVPASQIQAIELSSDSSSE